MDYYRLINKVGYFVSGLILVILLSCGSEKKETGVAGITVNDPNLTLQLVAEQPDIMTPIGMTIDDQDALYILESHTHTPPKDYQGPKHDRIKKGIDKDADGIPDEWIVFADGIEDGMNLIFVKGKGIFMTTKKSVQSFQDTDGDGKSDIHQYVLRMEVPTDPYDHAAILGLAAGPDNWLYVSRGNTGSKYWKVVGRDSSYVEGYGDGGSVFRCKIDGASVEEVATGFWNSFDIKFTAEGRLLLTDNDPDSRGPNRLIEIVPGGDYGYKSLYGGSGIHPYLSWNAELPGTLPYAAPLGEAPCALIDASFTNFGDDYANSILVNVWEENNIVKIPLSQKGSSVYGEPEVLVQGDSLFHPVAFATTSKGDLYITDWVVRQYPNHGYGRIFLLSTKDDVNEPIKPSNKSIRFENEDKSVDDLIAVLKSGDKFEKTVARHQLSKTDDLKSLFALLSDSNAQLRLQGLLIFLKRSEAIDRTTLSDLLSDTDKDIRQMTLVYIGTKLRTDMEGALIAALKSGVIEAQLFETFMATIRHLQPAFVDGYSNQTEDYSKNIQRELPATFIASIVQDKSIDEATKAIALPYLKVGGEEVGLILGNLEKAKNKEFLIALVKSLKNQFSKEIEQALLRVVTNEALDSEIRSIALLYLGFQSGEYCKNVTGILDTDDESLQYAAIKYLSKCASDENILAAVDGKTNSLDATALSLWNRIKGGEQPTEIGYDVSRTNKGSIVTGRLVFESLNTMCLTCHQVNGWGGTFGPNLSRIGSSKSKNQLIDAILEPSKEIAPEWQGWMVEDAEGKKHYGRQIDVHLNYIELMNMNGTYDSYKKPKSFKVSDKSLMPEGLQNSMTASEFSDLIAYLVSLK